LLMTVFSFVVAACVERASPLSSLGAGDRLNVPRQGPAAHTNSKRETPCRLLTPTKS
jgi:hypothetical protein